MTRYSQIRQKVALRQQILFLVRLGPVPASLVGGLYSPLKNVDIVAISKTENFSDGALTQIERGC